MAAEIPVACRCLTKDYAPQNQRFLLSSTGLLKTEELADGDLIHTPGDKKWLAVAGELIAAERECCPFLRFELTAEPAMGPVTVRMTGPAGTKESA